MSIIVEWWRVENRRNGKGRIINFNYILDLVCYFIHFFKTVFTNLQANLYFDVTSEVLLEDHSIYHPPMSRVKEIR